MPKQQKYSIHLARIAGIDLYLHWSWFLVALIEIQLRRNGYKSVVWNVLEYLALFAIVLMHEFGHALACRQVGGKADRIMLWPLGGVAYVNPPQRPGAVLWSIAAGPLVNVVLLPVFVAAAVGGAALGWFHSSPDVYRFLVSLAVLDGILLVFNILPVYPLDGGKMLWALLWFALGRGRSLLVSAWLGVVGVAGLVVLGLWFRSFWTILIGVYMATQCWRSIKVAKAMLKVEQLPKRMEFHCPSCGAAPPAGECWICDKCKGKLDTFSSDAICPHCGEHHSTTMCTSCGSSGNMLDWGARPTWMSASVAPEALGQD